MIKEIDQIDNEGVVILFKSNLIDEDYLFFNKLQSSKDLYLLEEYLLKKAHKVDLMYEDYSTGALVLKMIKTYEDYLQIPKTSQGIFIIANSFIDQEKLTRYWTCRSCMTKNQKDALTCKNCCYFISLVGQVRQINYFPFASD